MKMKNWITARKERNLKSAMESAVSRYSRIEKTSLVLDKLDTILADEGVNLEEMLDGKFNMYDGYNYVHMYSYADDIKEEVQGFLLAMVEVKGDGKRVKDGEQLKYTWEGIIPGVRMELQVNPGATGCKLVEKTVVVPAQPATTKIVFEVECFEPVKEA